MARKRKQRKKIRQRRGDRALRSAAGDLFYEWKTAQNTVELIYYAKKDRDQVRLNAALESLLIHARNIRDFFNAQGRTNDILAIDFLDRNIRVRMTYLRRNKKRLDRAIAHLSYSRSRIKKNWDVRLIVSEIDDSMRRFINRLKLKHPLISEDVFDSKMKL